MSSRIESSLGLLDTLLRQRAPSISSALRPPLGALELQNLLEPWGYRLPDEAAALYRWHDGCEFVDGTNRAQLFPGGEMLPLHEAIEKRNEASDADRLHSPQGWKSTWFPLFVGYQWRYWVVDNALPDSPVISFDWVDLPETWGAYESLKLMLNAIVSCWNKGAYREGPHASVEEDRRAVAEINRELDGDSPDVNGLVASLAGTGDHNFSQALARLRTRLYPEAVPALIRLLDTESRGRIAAVELLGAIGGPQATAKLRHLADSDPEDLVRDFARHTLDEVG